MVDDQPRARDVAGIGHRISDRELWACAWKIIDGYGSDAELHAAMRADELLAEGDLEGERVWKAILARIVDWRREDLASLFQ